MLIRRLAGGATLILSMTALPARAEQARGVGAQPLATANPSVRSARALYEEGKKAGKPDERRRCFQAGIAAARERLVARPDDPEALLWLAANLGAEALERGKFAALKVLPEMERLLLRLEAVAPQFEHAAAARTLARLYHKAPSVISIGSNDKARVWFEKALARAADFPGNLALAAEFFADVGDEARARDLASACLKSPQLALAPEGPEWRAIATDVLDEVGG